MTDPEIKSNQRPSNSASNRVILFTPQTRDDIAKLSSQDKGELLYQLEQLRDEGARLRSVQTLHLPGLPVYEVLRTSNGNRVLFRELTDAELNAQGRPGQKGYVLLAVVRAGEWLGSDLEALVRHRDAGMDA